MWPWLAAGGLSLLGNVIGGSMQKDATHQANEANAKLQREFAQHGIEWRVADAGRSGIHPLAALGAQVSGGAPSYQVGDVGHFAANVGQDLSRAVTATWSPEEKADAFGMEMAKERLKGVKLQNQMLLNQVEASRRALLQQPGSAPGVPSDSQIVRGPNGEVYKVPSEEFAQAAQGAFMPGVEWYWRNRLVGPLMEHVSDRAEERAKALSGMRLYRGDGFDWLRDVLSGR